MDFIFDLLGILLKFLFGTTFGWLCTLIGATWIITTYRKKTGEVDSRFVETNQTRNELRKRNKAAMENLDGPPVSSKNVRGGYYNESENTIVNGQIVKPPKK